MHSRNQKNNRKEIVFFDEKNPRSLVNLLPEALGKRLRDAWKSEDAYLFGLSERRLRRDLVGRGKAPSATDSRIRLQFWLEYDRIQVEDALRIPEMNMAYVIGFAMAKEAFYTHYITDNCALAWLLCPPVQYVDALEEVLRESMERVREALDSDLIGEDGKPRERMLAWLLRTDSALFQRWAALRKVSGVQVPDEPGEEKGSQQSDSGGEGNSEEAEREARRRRLAELQAAQSGESAP